MDIKRVILGAALAMLTYSLWTAWQVDYPKSISASQVNAVQHARGTSNTKEALLPSLGEQGITHDEPATYSNVPQQHARTEKNNHVIHVKTDVLALQIDLTQGDVISADLLNYPQSLKADDTPFSLLTDKNNERYVANSSILLVNQGEVEQTQPEFKAGESQYALSADQNELIVTLTGLTKQGVKIKKTFIFKRGSYLINVRYTLLNQGAELWKGHLNTQLLRDLPKEDKTSLSHVGSYTGASYSNPGHHRYKKLTFKDMAKSPLSTEVDGGWIAMQQRYFLTAWIPAADSKERFYSRASGGRYAIGAVSQPINLTPGATETVGSQLYLGPEISDALKPIAPGLDLTIDYGWLWFISSFLFSLMKLIHSVIGNWGWSIVLVTVLVKLAFYRLSAKSYRSMAGMRQLQPKLQALREQYGEDKAKISQATMALYREEKVNPLSGCLPMLVQAPIFMALYWVCLESVELRQAPFIFWIKDLASPDPYHVLTLLMGGTMLIQQRLNPAPPDPMQAKMMMFLPVLMTALFWNFPSGLALYWTVNNTLTILQQWYITRKFGAK
ncbi:MAG: membrane protein insertase YidC [Gammaproteobacteria bacterium]|nr:membrane protein insertase YidC [Gammaproteobacteria bacterium]MCH9764292.1 membrane protein insertase YidC [Gammaproteobacteria bacterium]